MIIPFDQINTETLRNIIRENILRGVDEIGSDFDLEKEIDKVVPQIQIGKIKVVYSQTKNDVTLVSSEQFKK